MKISRVAAVVAVACIAAMVWAGPVNTDWDHSADFSKFRTYTWAKGTAIANPLMQDRAVAAVDEQLQAKGLKKADKDADLWVVLHASTHSATQYDSTGFGYVGFGTSTTTVQNIPLGSLVVDLAHIGDGKLVWRGTATNVVIPSNPQRATKKLNGAIAKMFKNFPPEE